MYFILNKTHHVFLNIFEWIDFILADNVNIHKSLNGFEIRQDPTMEHGHGTWTAALAALECLKKIP